MVLRSRLFSIQHGILNHRRTKTFHSSVETPTFTFGRSNLGPRSTGSGADAVAVGAVF